MNELLEWEVFYLLDGATLSMSQPLQLGPYTIYNSKAHQPIIAAKYPGINTEDTTRRILQMFFPWITDQGADPETVIISTQVSAQNERRAKELAEPRFYQFENIMRYMIADKEGKRDIGIFDYQGWRRLRSVALSRTGSFSSAPLQGSYELVRIDDPCFVDEQRGHAWIWKTLNCSNLSKLQKRVLAAIEWTGKGLRDKDSARAFVQFIFAIEALLLSQEKGVLVNPSVASQLAESSAFIVGSNVEERLEIEKLVKEFYNIRSAIAHGGSQSVCREVVSRALKLVKDLVTQMTTHPDLSAMKSIEELQTWVKRQKYS